MTVIKDWVSAMTGLTVEDQVQVQKLWNGYGSLDRFFLNCGSNSTVIVKSIALECQSSHPRGWSSDLSHQRKVRSYEIEAAWYKNFANSCPKNCRIPEFLGSKKIESKLLIMMEDLDCRGYSQRLENVNWDQIQDCLSWLGYFHGYYLNHSSDQLWPIGSYWHLETRPDEWAAMPSGKLKDLSFAIDSRLNGSQFQTIIHGDAKLANFCFSQDGAGVAAVDFQYVGRGTGVKDLAYFVGSSMSAQQCLEREDEILKVYFSYLLQSLEKYHPSISHEAIEKEWRELYPFAWADFHRFMLGWAPNHWKLHKYSDEMCKKVFKQIGDL